MAVITVVGAGVMGTALTFPAADNGHTIRLVGTHLDQDIIESCQATRLHPTLKRNIPDGVEPYFHTQLGEAMDGAEIVVLGVNSQGVEWAAENLAAHLQPNQTILMVTKGLASLDGQSISILPDWLHANLPETIRDEINYAAIGGPSIAGELAAKRHTSVVFVSRNEAILPMLRECFATDYYHIFTSTDMIGVEVCVALKNPYAFAVGLAIGLVERHPDEVANAQMHNYAAAIFAQGLAETAYLVQKMGGQLESVFSLPGAGDLYVTTQGGRNSRFGRLIGLGLSYSDAVEEMPNTTVEGVDAIIAVGETVEKMIAQGDIGAESLPLFRRLYTILTQHEEVAFSFNEFFSELPFVPPPTTA